MGKTAVYCTKLPQNRVSRVFPALLLTISLILMGSAMTGHAEECEKPACRDAVYRHGWCYKGPDPISRAESHSEARCEAGWALDYERGTCVKEGCCEKSVCLPDEIYRGAVDYRGELRGDCDSPPGAFGVDSHALRPCQPGWDLDGERGVCVDRGCMEAKITPPPTGVARPAVDVVEVVRKPDLTAKSFELAKTGVCISGGSLFEFRVKVTNSGTADAPPTGSTPMLRVFNAANIGWATEVPLDPLEQGTFQNLVVPVRYSSRYRGLVSSSDFLGFTVMVDHRNLVDELYEGNNAKTIRVRVPEQCKPLVDVPPGVDTRDDEKLPGIGIKSEGIKKTPESPSPEKKIATQAVTPPVSKQSPAANKGPAPAISPQKKEAISPLAVERVQVKNLKEVKGGEEAVVILTGKNLDRVTAAEVPGAKVQILKKTPAGLRLKLTGKGKALKQAAAAVKLRAGAEFKEVPLGNEIKKARQVAAKPEIDTWREDIGKTQNMKGMDKAMEMERAKDTARPTGGGSAPGGAVEKSVRAADKKPGVSGIEPALRPGKQSALISPSIREATLSVYAIPFDAWCESRGSETTGGRVEVDINFPRSADGTFVPAHLVVDTGRGEIRKSVRLGAGRFSLVSNVLDFPGGEICDDRCVDVWLEVPKFGSARNIKSSKHKACIP